MALPFYNQVDQDIYAGGEHFIPQERFRLGYTAPPSIANASTGITTTQAAVPYIWPPQGGGGGGGGGFPNTNKFGLNLDTMKTVSQGKYTEQGGPANMYGGDYVKTDRQIAQDEHGNWKDVNTNQNVYHGNIDYKGVIGNIVDLATGKSKNKDSRIGSWYGSDWSDEDEDAGLYSRTIGPKNFIQRWKIKRDFKRAKDIKDAADAAAVGKGTDIGGGWTQTNTGGGGATFSGPGGTTHEGWSNTPAGIEAASESEGSFAQGGRIGLYAGGDPEEPAENVYEFMQDQGVPFGEMVEASPTEEQIAMVIDMDGQGIDMETISSITQLGKETIMNILGVEMAQGGIARLL